MKISTLVKPFLISVLLVSFTACGGGGGSNNNGNINTNSGESSDVGSQDKVITKDSDNDDNVSNKINLGHKEVKDQNQSLDTNDTIIADPSPSSSKKNKQAPQDNVNHTPTIAGSPKTTTNIYDAYQFIPTVSDIDNDTLTFSIKNKPAWTEFNTTTGVLHGTSTVEGNYTNIIISVSDGIESVSLPSFDIEVLPALNLAHVYGEATQGDTYANNYARYAIDENVTTYNHADEYPPDNWWQLKLPDGVKIHKIVLYNKHRSSRLANVKMYLNNQPHMAGSTDMGAMDKNLTDETIQIFTYDPPIERSYLVMQGNLAATGGDRSLHLSEVKVYGETPPTPVFAIHKTSYLISGTSAVGDIVTTLGAVDYQGDDITYSISDANFTIDTYGNIKVASQLHAGVHNVVVTISDGMHTAITNLTITVTSNNAVGDALSSGSATLVTEKELILETRAELGTLRSGESLLGVLYENDSISYAPSHNSQIIHTTGDVHKVYSILQGTKQNTLAVAGTKSNARFAAFGSIPMWYFQNGKNLSYETPMKRLLLWLIGGKPLDSTISDQNKTIVLSFANSVSDTKDWLNTNYPNWTIKECKDITTHANCLSGADLVIQGSNTNDTNADTIETNLKSLLDNGVPILYLHPDWGTNKTAQNIGKLFEFSMPYGGNWWASDKADWADVGVMHSTQFDLNYGAIDTMLSHFQAQDYNFDWSKCKDSHGNFGQNYDNCEDVVGLKSEFQLGASKVKIFMNGLDNNKKNIFTTDDYKLQKLLALIGDKFRQNVTYPMDKVTTDDNLFMKSYYADHAVYNYRTINPTQPDMGNFSRSDFSHITPITKTVTFTSRKPFRSTGAYALPGQTFKVTRDDDSNLTVKVFINTLRSGATHQYQQDGYNRPKYLQTPHFEIKSGESIEITSPYGGVIELEFSKKDLPIKIKFENVGEHAYWASTADNASFDAKLSANEFDWAELVTSGFEVHSKLDKMIQTIDGTDSKWSWGTAENLAAATVKYTSNYPLVLAGFKGPGIDVVSEIHDFATNNNLTIETVEQVKHMNADQASCGYGCSGNPYDAYWAFEPIGHGDIHEIGHGLEKSRFRFEGFEVHASTNPYSYYTKSKYNEITGGDPDCQNLPFKEVFEKLQASVNENNSTAYLKTHLWDDSGWSQQFMITLQAMMHTQKMGKLQNGWHLLARLHILEREIKRVKDDWDNKKASIGFSNYTLDEFNNMRKNDWILVSYSFAVGLDFRDYLTMMGMEYSQKASDQVASFNYPMVPKKFFVSTPNGYCKSDGTYGAFLDKSMLDVDGNTTFPY